MNSTIRQIINIANSDLTIIEHQGERVVTLGMIDQVHQRPDGTARKRLNDNRSRFIEGKHLFKICASEFRTHNPGVISNKSHEDVILLTQRGYLLLVKSFTDELSWQVQDMLVDGYFEGQRQAGQPAAALISNHRLRLALLKELYRTRDAGMRASIHEQLAAVSQSLGLSIPAIDSIGHAAPTAPDILRPFWEALAFLDGKGVIYNHAHPKSGRMGFNTEHLATLFEEHGVKLSIDQPLRNAWRSSLAPKFIKNDTLSSILWKKSVKCWIFDAKTMEI